MITREFFYKPILLALAVLALTGAAFAAPVAKVAAFPDGEGLEEFLNTIDTSKIIRTEQPDGLVYPVAIVVLPLHKSTRFDVYRAVLDENTYTMVPDYGEVLAEGEYDHGLQFWFHEPGSIPTVVVVAVIKDDIDPHKQHYFTYNWTPGFSGEDGSLVTNDEFIPF